MLLSNKFWTDVKTEKIFIYCRVLIQSESTVWPRKLLDGRSWSSLYVYLSINAKWLFGFLWFRVDKNVIYILSCTRTMYMFTMEQFSNEIDNFFLLKIVQEILIHFSPTNSRMVNDIIFDLQLFLIVTSIIIDIRSNLVFYFFFLLRR